MAIETSTIWRLTCTPSILRRYLLVSELKLKATNKSGVDDITGVKRAPVPLLFLVKSRWQLHYQGSQTRFRCWDAQDHLKGSHDNAVRFSLHRDTILQTLVITTIITLYTFTPKKLPPLPKRNTTYTHVEKTKLMKCLFNCATTGTATAHILLCMPPVPPGLVVNNLSGKL